MPVTPEVCGPNAAPVRSQVNARWSETASMGNLRIESELCKAIFKSNLLDNSKTISFRVISLV